MIEQKIEQFLQHFKTSDKYVFLGFSRELVYFIDTLDRNNIPIRPEYFSDTLVLQESVGNLRELVQNITDPVGEDVLDRFQNITVAPPTKIDKSHKIIVATERFRNEAYELLDSMGLVRDVDYCYYKDAVSYWTYGLHKKTFVNRVDQFITSRCTLNCTYCNMYIPFFSDAKDRTLEQLKAEADLFFSKIDTLGIFHIVGGEPLLNKYLEEYLDYLGTNYYQKQFHHFWLTSNGTVTPSPSLVDIFKKYNIYVSITDYSNVLPHIGNKTKRNLALFAESNVDHLHNDAKTWIDFGDPRRTYGTSEAALQKHFQRCTAPYRGLAGDRFYYCNLSVAADESRSKPAVAGDYIVMDESLNPLQLVWFDLGNVPKGYISLCESCAGCNTGIGESVPAGRSQGLRILPSVVE